MVIKVATAECFTHGKIAEEIHAFSRGYPQNYDWRIDPKKYKLSLIAGLFIPTLSGVKSILRLNPLPVITSLDDIKVYDQAGDITMSLMMAEAVKEITGADIGIGTTAGIGKGGVAIVCTKGKKATKSEIFADIRDSSPEQILMRQKSGIDIALLSLEQCLQSCFDCY
jgi:uncharacterized protein (UPF0254 family)